MIMRNARTPVQYVYEGMLWIEIKYSNGNGDLNAGGGPRMDPIDDHCYVSGESLRRKVRDYIIRKYGCKSPFDILIRSSESIEREDGGNLTIDDMVHRVRKDAGLGDSADYRYERETGQKASKKTAKKASKKTAKKASKKTAKKGSKGEAAEDRDGDLSPPDARRLQDFVLENYVDTRLFGFLGKTGNSPLAGVKGPLAITDGKSVHPVVEIQQANTRAMVTRESDKKNRQQTIGNRTVLRYALVQHHFTLTPNAARITGMTEEDFHLALEAIINCWTGDMAPHRRVVFRGMWIFKSEKPRRPVPYDWTDIVPVTCKLERPEEASRLSDFNFPTRKDELRLDLLPKGVEVLDFKDIAEMIGLYDEGVGDVEAAE